MNINYRYLFQSQLRCRQMYRYVCEDTPPLKKKSCCEYYNEKSGYAFTSEELPAWVREKL